MTAEYETFHTLGGGTERVLTGVRGPTVYAPDKLPLVNNGPEYTVHVDDVDGYRAQFSPPRAPMAAPDLRPSDAPGAAAPMETGAQQQLEHQIQVSPSARYPVWDCERCRMRSPEKPRASCMQGHADGCPMVAPEPLAKVLPAGGPLTQRK